MNIIELIDLLQSNPDNWQQIYLEIVDLGYDYVWFSGFRQHANLVDADPCSSKAWFDAVIEDSK